MPRQPRFNLPGHPQHVIIRGNNRQPIFKVESDYHYYLEKLKQACGKHLCDLHAYVLMTNHVHLLVTPHTIEGISKAIQMLGRYYVQYFNQSYHRTGTLWEGRYKATLIDSERYLLTCYRYIELNPVRAEMTSHPRDYPWSSYQFNAEGKTDELVAPHEEYRMLGTDDELRQMAYRALFETQISENALEEIRECTNKSWALGTDLFKERIGKQLKRRADPLPRGGDRKSKEFKLKVEINRV